MSIPGNLLSPTTESVHPSASGWRARLNCTTFLGSGGRNGDGALGMTSAAAGEMQAETASASPITPGTTYFVFADASSSTQPERIGIEWLDADLAPVGSITWSLATASASSTWHRVSVAGVCPVGATRARVVLSATADAASRLHYWENVYLGPPWRTSGNLLGFNTESGGELDLSGWVAETNGSLTRTVPAISWSVNWYYSGGHMVTLTTAVAGDTSLVITARPSVEPGVDYQAYAYLRPPTASADTWIELRWHDADGVQVGAARADLDQPGVGTYRQRVSGIAPTGAATCSLAAGIDGASAGQALSVEGAVIRAAPALQEGSLVSYEDASFEQGVGSWQVVSGPAVISRSSPWGAASYEGSYSLKVESGAATSVLRSARYPISVDSAEDAYRWAIRSNVVSGGWSITRGARWWDADGIDLGATDLGATPIPSPGWWDLNATRIPPASAAEVAIELTLTADTAGSVWHMDYVRLFKHLVSTVVTADAPRGRIVVTLRELTEGALLTLWRVVAGQRTIVRGRSGLLDRAAITSETVVIEDYEAPLGVDVHYYMEQVSATTLHVTAHRVTASARLPSPVRGLCWIKDPAQPQRNVLVQAVAAPDWSRPIVESEHQVRGRRNSVILTDVRGGLTGELVVRTRTDSERQLLHFVLDTGRPLLIQHAPGLGLADTYVAVGEAQEQRVQGYGGDPWRQWVLPLRQVDRPAGGVAGTAAWTVQDLKVEHATVRDVVHAYATVLDLALDQRR